MFGVSWNTDGDGLTLENKLMEHFPFSGLCCLSTTPLPSVFIKEEENHGADWGLCFITEPTVLALV